MLKTVINYLPNINKMSESSSKTILAVAGGFVIGALAGAVVGVLFAPDKGSETRKKVSKKITDFSEEIEDKIDEYAESIKSRKVKLAEESNNSEKD